MSQLRRLTDKEINFLTSDVKNQKLDIIRILKSKIKVYKLNKTEIKKIKLFIETLVNGNKAPRYLHEEEIDYILSFLPKPPSALKSVMEFNRNQILKSDAAVITLDPGISTLPWEFQCIFVAS